MIRIASVPAEHPYPRHIQPADDSADVEVLDEIYRAPGVWWPPRRLEAAWVRESGSEFDLIHAHFGFESLDVDDLVELVAALEQARKPLVITVHDLQNPHLKHDDEHLRQIGALVSAAQAVVTLTPGAAAEIRRRWGREATVLPHPHIVPLDDFPIAPPVGHRVGLHLGDLRERVDLTPIVDDLRQIARTSQLVIDVQDDAWASASPELRALVESLGADEIAIHPRLPDAELYAAVGRTRVQILPYGRGTHSGWLEMCLDLGVCVAAPQVGYLREQHPGRETVAIYDRAARGSLAAAVAQLLDVPPANGGWAAFRKAQREQVAAAYAEIYRQAIEEVR